MSAFFFKLQLLATPLNFFCILYYLLCKINIKNSDNLSFINEKNKKLSARSGENRQ